MRKRFRKFAHMPGFKEHLRNRPSGFPRFEWGRDWLLAHGVRPDHIALKNPLDFSPYETKKVPTRTRAADRRASDDFLHSPEWRRLRMQVITTRGNRCECCGASPRDGVTVINVDHIKPRKLFPELALIESNLQVLCAVCNHGKGNWDQTDWRPTQSPAPVELPPTWSAPFWAKTQH